MMLGQYLKAASNTRTKTFKLIPTLLHPILQHKPHRAVAIRVVVAIIDACFIDINNRTRKLGFQLFSNLSQRKSSSVAIPSLYNSPTRCSADRPWDDSPDSISRSPLAAAFTYKSHSCSAFVEQVQKL